MGRRPDSRANRDVNVAAGLLRLLPIMAVLALLAFPPSAAAAGQFVVTNTNDSGTGSLRQAISDANGAGGGTITFNIPGAAVAPRISLQSALVVTAPVTIDGTTQPGIPANMPGVTLDGNNTAAAGLDLAIGATHAGSCCTI